MNPKALDQFLASVEHRAFRIAVMAVRNDETALDLVQDAMMRLAEKYGDRPATEWPMLFQRILQNAILDHHRRQKVRRTWVSLFEDLTPAAGDDESGQDGEGLFDAPDNRLLQPEMLAERRQHWDLLSVAIENLPIRQQQAFLLRYWEGLDIAQTAQAMGCSEGSVKTHCFRAIKNLGDALKLIEPQEP